MIGRVNVPRRQMPSGIEKTDHRAIIETLFETHKFLFKTWGPTTSLVEDKNLNFFLLYSEKTNELTAETTLNIIFKKLLINESLILFNDKICQQEINALRGKNLKEHLVFSSVPENEARFIVGLDRRSIFKLLLYKNKIIETKNLNLDDYSLGNKFKMRFYISNSGKNKGKGINYLLVELVRIIAEAQQLPEQPKLEGEEGKLQPRLPTAPFKGGTGDSYYLDSFLDQPIFNPNISNISLMHYFRDILFFIEHGFSRRCPACGTRIGSHFNIESTEPIIKKIKKKEEVTITILIKQLLETDLDQDEREILEGQLKQMLPEKYQKQSLQTFLYEPEGKEDREALIIEYPELKAILAEPIIKKKEDVKNPEEEAETEEVAISVTKRKGGAYGIYDPTEKIDLPPDSTILEYTAIADQYLDNSMANAVTYESFISGKPENVKPDNMDHLKKIQSKYANRLKCPNKNCTSDKLLTKARMFCVSKLVSQIIIATFGGGRCILVGSPGDGKTEICVQICQYLQWLYGRDFVTYGVTEASNASSFTAKINLERQFTGNENVNRVEYGIFTRALMRNGYAGQGKGCNLILDEMNRVEFKQLGFMMQFFVPPYQYLLDVDEFRPINNPNSGNKCVWFFIATMNTEDIGNEDISLAAKRRFFYVNVQYTPEETAEIIQRSFGLESPKDWVCMYLLAILEWTNELKARRMIKYPAGIRDLIKVHETFMNGTKMIYSTFAIKIPDIKGVTYPGLKDVEKNWEMEQKTIERTNIVTMKPLSEISSQNYVDVQIKEEFNGSVISTLIEAIVDENAPLKKEEVRGAWYSPGGTSAQLDVIWNLISPNISSLKKRIGI